VLVKIDEREGRQQRSRCERSNHHHNDGTNFEVHLVSDGSGYFKAPQFPAAIYTVTGNAAQFAPFKEINVTVQVGQTTEVDPRDGRALKDAPGYLWAL
jgi:hypothetical protein